MCQFRFFNFHLNFENFLWSSLYRVFFGNNPNRPTRNQEKGRIRGKYAFDSSPSLRMALRDFLLLYTIFGGDSQLAPFVSLLFTFCPTLFAGGLWCEVSRAQPAKRVVLTHLPGRNWRIQLPSPQCQVFVRWSQTHHNAHEQLKKVTTEKDERQRKEDY